VRPQAERPAVVLTPWAAIVMDMFTERMIASNAPESRWRCEADKVTGAWRPCAPEAIAIKTKFPKTLLIAMSRPSTHAAMPDASRD
jgi:hypothetical protein